MELKSSEKELVAANRSVELANKSAEIAQTTLQAAISSFAAASTSVVKTVAPKVKASKLTAPLIVKERKRKSLTVEPIAGDDEESEVEAPLPVAVKPATKPRAKKVVAPIVAEPTVDSDSQDDGAFYRPSKPKTRISLGSASAPSRAASLAPASPVAVVKKAKIAKVKAVLAEKSTNAKSVEKVKMVAAKEKGKGKRAAEVVEEDVEEPAKKKKTKLFLGARQFTWDKFVPVRPSPPTSFCVSAQLTRGSEYGRDDQFARATDCTFPHQGLLDPSLPWHDRERTQRSQEHLLPLALPFS